MSYQWNRHPFKGIFPEIYGFNRSVVKSAYRTRFRGVTQSQLMIVWVQSGWQDYRGASGWRRMSAGDMLVLSPGQKLDYAGCPVTPIRSYEMIVSIGMARPFLGLRSLEPLRRRLVGLGFSHGVAPARTGQAFKALERELAHDDVLKPARVLEQVLQILNDAASSSSPGTAGVRRLPEPVARAVQFMERRLDEPLTLADLVRFTGYSRASLFRVFQRYTGVTPMRKLTELRVRRAASLLAESELKVTQIAMQTGFASSQHLATAFGRLMLVSPTAYRRGVARA